MMSVIMIGHLALEQQKILNKIAHIECILSLLVKYGLNSKSSYSIDNIECLLKLLVNYLMEPNTTQ